MFTETRFCLPFCSLGLEKKTEACFLPSRSFCLSLSKSFRPLTVIGKQAVVVNQQEADGEAGSLIGVLSRLDQEGGTEEPPDAGY